MTDSIVALEIKQDKFEAELFAAFYRIETLEKVVDTHVMTIDSLRCQLEKIQKRQKETVDRCDELEAEVERQRYKIESLERQLDAADDDLRQVRDEMRYST